MNLSPLVVAGGVVSTFMVIVGIFYVSGLSADLDDALLMSIITILCIAIYGLLGASLIAFWGTILGIL